MFAGTAGRSDHTDFPLDKGSYGRRGKNRTAVAVANKNARIVWVLLSRQQNYRPMTT
jgi:hypothetical protein